MGIRFPRNTIFLSVWVQVLCLSGARHEYIKVSFDSIIALDKSEDTTAGSRKWMTQLE